MNNKNNNFLICMISTSKNIVFPMLSIHYFTIKIEEEYLSFLLVLFYVLILSNNTSNFSYFFGRLNIDQIISLKKFNKSYDSLCFNSGILICIRDNL